ncbi:MAG: helix-turn-helix transcriptional regulator [Pseudomonadota bacterium]
MLPSSIELPLVLGRLLGHLRNEARLTQRAFAASLGMGQAKLAGIEAGRTNAYVAQLLVIERGLIERGALTRHGQVLELLDLALRDLAERGTTTTHGRVALLADRDEIAELDRILGTVVQGYFERERRKRPAEVIMAGDSGGDTAYGGPPTGPVTRRRVRGVGGEG